VVPSMAFCNSGEFIVAKLGNFFCNFVRFYFAINRPTAIIKLYQSLHDYFYVRSQFNTKKKGHFRVHNAGKGSKIKAFEVIS